jgi:hypothetical protein
MSGFMGAAIRSAGDSPATALAGIRITDGGPLMLPGHALWMRRGVPVWMGILNQPVEDVEFDEIILHRTDIARIKGEVSGA